MVKYNNEIYVYPSGFHFDTIAKAVEDIQISDEKEQAMVKRMSKGEFTNRRTKIISKMLDFPDDCGIYSTTVCYAELDDIFDELTECRNLSWAQENTRHNIDRTISNLE